MAETEVQMQQAIIQAGAADSDDGTEEVKETETKSQKFRNQLGQVDSYTKILKRFERRAKSRKELVAGDDGVFAESSETLNSISDINNPDWRTPGCRDLRRITHYNGEREILYFPPDKFHHKKVFVSFSIEDVEVDAVHETFHLKFTLQFNWMPTESDYRSMYRATLDSVNERRPEILQQWRPEWVPQVEFDHVIKVNRREWVCHPEVPEKGPFRLATYTGKWGTYWKEQTERQEEQQSEMERTKWICAEMECDIVFQEEQQSEMERTKWICA